MKNFLKNFNCGGRMMFDKSSFVLKALQRVWNSHFCWDLQNIGSTRIFSTDCQSRGVCYHTKEFYYSLIILCFRINFVLVGISHNITLPQSWRTPVQMTYYASTTAMSSLSIFGCLIIMYYYATLKQLRNRSRQLLICLTVCDLLIAVGNIIGISL